MPTAIHRDKTGPYIYSAAGNDKIVRRLPGCDTTSDVHAALWPDLEQLGFSRADRIGLALGACTLQADGSLRRDAAVRS